MHLLKARSNPVPSKLKRKKIQIGSTFKEFQDSKKKDGNMGKQGQAQEEKLFLQHGPNGQPIMAPMPKGKDAKMNTK